MDHDVAQSPTRVSTLFAVRTALALLTPKDRRRYVLVVLAQMATSVLDLLGVLLLGVVGILGTAAIQGTGIPESLMPVAERLGVEDVQVVTLAAVCSAIAAGLLLTKSLLSALLMRTIFRFLGARQGDVASRLAGRLLSQPLLALESRSSQELTFSISSGVSVLIISMLGSLAIFLSEVALLALLFIALVILDPVVTIAASVFFAAVGYLIHLGLGSWAERVGSVIGETAVLGQQRLQEAMVAYREIFVLGRRANYIDAVSSLWVRAGKAVGEQLFLMQVPKIAYETALVLGGIALVAWQFSSSGTVEAVTTVVVFIAAGSRVLPSMLRINTLVLGIRAGVGQAGIVFPIIRELEDSASTSFPVGTAQSVDALHARDYTGFTPSVELADVTVTYPKAGAPALRDVTLHIEPGARVAIVGSTGAGKSTLADIILGVIAPEQGSIAISGRDPHDVISTWPGCIGYVPQNVAMVNGTVRENVALGLGPEAIDDDQVWDALEQARLADFLRQQRDGIDTLVGERGVRLSGGQRQRLGLARALYSAPRLLVLDEATSALDAETESLIGEALRALSREVTTITIAHRLATVRDADLIVFLVDGLLRDQGTFDEVRGRNPAFDRQASLSGIEA
ncbi:MAG: ABC transporter ATP-binding protein [Candidatus Nanopelagicales bacterium]|nr:ABC transporter ATP-binding protein [Candidatus Nanopelagicales bacterium]